MCTLAMPLAAAMRADSPCSTSRGALPVVRALADYLCTELPRITEMDGADSRES